MPEKTYRLLSHEETIEIAAKQGLRFAPEDVGRQFPLRIIKNGNSPSHAWDTDPHSADVNFEPMFGCRTGAVVASLPIGLKCGDLQGDNENEIFDTELFREKNLFQTDPYAPHHHRTRVTPGISGTARATIERVGSLELVSTKIFQVRQALFDAIGDGRKSIHFSINFPFIAKHLYNGAILGFQDLASEELIGILIDDIRKHSSFQDMLKQRDPKDIEPGGEKAIQREIEAYMRQGSRDQALENYGLSSFRIRPLPSGIPVNKEKSPS